jgi:hypothetical protein
VRAAAGRGVARVVIFTVVGVLASVVFVARGHAVSPPPNDAFVNAQPLTTHCGSVSGSNALATEEPGDPDLTLSSLGSVWYAWLSPKSATLTVRVAPGTISLPRLRVYLGDQLGALKLLASNDANLASSSVSFTASAGWPLRIEVDSVKTQGSFVLSWATANDNDAFACAKVFTGSSWTDFAGSNVGATMEPGEPEDGGSSGAASVWYKWTPPAGLAGEPVSLDTGATTQFYPCLDTIISVYTGASLSTLTLVQPDPGFRLRNDDAGFPSCGWLSYLSWYVPAVPPTYWIEVDTYNPAAQGSFVLREQQPPSACGSCGSPGVGVNEPAAGSSRIEETQRFVTTCSHPDGWHNLSTIDFRIGKGKGNGSGEPIALWAQYDEKRGVMRFYDPDTGRWSEGKPGSATVLSSRYAELRLADSSVVGSGPTGPSVRLTWAVVFKDPAVRTNYGQYLQIIDDQGHTAGLNRVGRWSITP